MERVHLFPLTSLRFFAALAIVLFHLDKHVPITFPNSLSLGVSFFFVLSGFILTHAYGEEFPIKQFFLNRFARLWPVHVFCFMLSILLLEAERVELSVRTLLNLTLLQAWVPLKGVPFAFNGPSWSISAELFFYALFPLLVKCHRLVLILVLCLAISILSFQFIELQSPSEISSIPIYSFLTAHYLLQFPPVRLAEFVAGILAGRLYKRGWGANFGGSFFEATAIVVMIYYSTWLSTLRSGDLPISAEFKLWFSQTGAMFVFAALIFVFAHGRGLIGKFISNRVFVKLGEISFCTYMFHYIVIRFCVENMSQVHWAINAVFVIVVSYGGSWLMYELVERIARRKILQFAEREGQSFRL